MKVELTAELIRSLRNPGPYEELVGYPNARELGHIWCIRHGKSPEGKKTGPQGQTMLQFAEPIDWMTPEQAARVAETADKKKPVVVFRSPEIAAELYRLGHKKVTLVTSKPCAVTQHFAKQLGYKYWIADDASFVGGQFLGDWRPANLDAPLRIRTTDVMWTRSKKGRNIKAIRGITEHGAWVKSYIDWTYRNAVQWKKITNSRHKYWSFIHNKRLENFPSIMSADVAPKQIRRCSHA